MLRCQPCGTHATTAIPFGLLLFSFCSVMRFHEAMIIFFIYKLQVGRERKLAHRERREKKKICKEYKKKLGHIIFFFSRRHKVNIPCFYLTSLMKKDFLKVTRALLFFCVS
jgi:hypothetical protein